MSEPDFSARCDQCFGLCCTALSFERSEQFGHDKLAGQPCQYLENDFRCRIHERREALGYEGCMAFDCLGAGQRASAIFAGHDWQRDAGVARQLHARFSLLLRLQEMRQALHTAGSLSLPQPLQQEREALLRRVGTVADSRGLDVDVDAHVVLAESRAFLKRLAPVLAEGA